MVFARMHWEITTAAPSDAQISIARVGAELVQLGVEFEGNEGLSRGGCLFQGRKSSIEKLRFVDLRNRYDRVVIRLPRGDISVLLRQQAVAFGPVDLEVALFDLVNLRPS